MITWPLYLLRSTSELLPLFQFGSAWTLMYVPMDLLKGSWMELLENAVANILKNWNTIDTCWWQHRRSLNLYVPSHAPLWLNLIWFWKHSEPCTLKLLCQLIGLKIGLNYFLLLLTLSWKTLYRLMPLTLQCLLRGGRGTLNFENFFNSGGGGGAKCLSSVVVLGIYSYCLLGLVFLFFTL